MSQLSKYSSSSLLFGLLLFFLPFGQALTLNIGFPLKISEIFLILIIGQLLLGYKLFIPKQTYVYITLILLLIVASLISIVINSFWEYDYALSLHRVKLGAWGDTVFKLFYLILAWLLFVISNSKFSLNNKFILDCWTWGTVISAIYCWYLFISGFLGIPEILLPGMDESPQVMNFNGASIIRCGTFKEGNYMGLYLFIMSAVFLFQKKYLLSFIIGLTILTTFSTAGLICIFIFWAIISLIYIIKNKLYSIFVFFVFFNVISYLAIINTNNPVKNLIIKKVFTNEEELKGSDQKYQWSKNERKESSITGLKIGINNPFWGVGLSNYSLHFDEYYSDLKYKNENFIAKKPIINNIYIEIFAETGIIGFIIWLLFLYLLVRKLFISHNWILGVASLLVFTYFIAFPTFTMFYVWVYFAYITYLEENKESILNGKQ